MSDERLKLGVFAGEPFFTTQGEMLADEVLSAYSGRYVVYDESDDYWKVAPDNAAAIGGYVEQSLTCGSTNGDDKLSIATNVDMFVCELPYAASGSDSSLTSAALLDLIQGADAGMIDVYVGSDIQYADKATNQNVLRPVGGSAENDTLYVSVVSSAIGRVS